MSVNQTDRIKHRTNTVEAMRQAKADGYRYVELDVHQCSDGTIVCRHSHRFDTDDCVWDLREIPYEVSMGPTLDEMVREANTIGMGLFVEIKDIHSSKPERYEQNVLDIIKKAENPVVILSFSARILTTVHMLDSEVPLIINSHDGRFALGDECIEKMCRGVCIPQSELGSSNAHSWPLFVYNITTPIPPGTLSGIAGVIE